MSGSMLEVHPWTGYTPNAVVIADELDRWGPGHGLEGGAGTLELVSMSEGGFAPVGGMPGRWRRRREAGGSYIVQTHSRTDDFSGGWWAWIGGVDGITGIGGIRPPEPGAGTNRPAPIETGPEPSSGGLGLGAALLAVALGFIIAGD